MQKIGLVLVLALVACSKSSGGSGSSADGDPCTAPINQAIDSMMGGNKGDQPPQMKEIGDKLRTIYIDACKTDHWSADVLACFNTAVTQPALKACRQKLPPDQAARVQQQIMGAMSSMGGGGGPMHGGAPSAPPAAPAPAGSGSN